MKNFNKAEYEYNSSGLRTSKTVNGEKTDFILDGIYVIAEIKDGDVTNYIRGLCGIIYSKDKKGTKTYYVTNNHGDVTALVNSSGTIIKEYTYDEYGVETNPDKEDTNPFRYCGEYYDTETGFIYLRARYYDPTLGRFISEDPARDEINWYIYSGNNPIMFIDPSGNIREAGYVNGVWCEDPDAYEFGNGSDTYKILTDLGNRWSSGNNSEKTKYSTLAEKVRKLARDGTPVQYAQNKIINELHKNAKIAKKNSNQKERKEFLVLYILLLVEIFLRIQQDFLLDKHMEIGIINIIQIGKYRMNTMTAIT